MSPINRNLLGLRVNTRLAGYAALAGAALAAPAVADAAIIYSGPVVINIPSTTSGIYINVVTGLAGTNAGTPGWDINPWNTSALEFFTPSPGPAGAGEMVGTGGTYFNLTLGTLISAASTFADAGTTAINPGTPLNFSSSNNIMGFRFINEAAGNVVEYGWVRISLSATAGGQPRAVVEYAYENDPQFGILAGAVPEPSTIALLGVMAAGALGVRAWRKGKAT